MSSPVETSAQLDEGGQQDLECKAPPVVASLENSVHGAVPPQTEGDDGKGICTFWAREEGLVLCDEPLDSLAELSMGDVQLRTGPLSIALFWMVYLVQAGIIVSVLFTESFFDDPIVDDPNVKHSVDDSAVKVKHAPDNWIVYYAAVIVFMVFFSLMVSADFFELLYTVVIQRFLTFNGSEKAHMHSNFILSFCGLLMSVVSMTLMVVVGWIMAAGETVHTVMGDAMSVYIILQLDDAVKDFINSSGCRLWHREDENMQPLRLSSAIRKAQVFDDEGIQNPVFSNGDEEAQWKGSRAMMRRMLGRARGGFTAFFFFTGIAAWIVSLHKLTIVGYVFMAVGASVLGIVILVLLCWWRQESKLVR